MFFRKRKREKELREAIHASVHDQLLPLVREIVDLAKSAVMTRSDPRLVDLVNDAQDKLMCRSWEEWQALVDVQQRERMEGQIRLADPPEPLVAAAGGKPNEAGAGAPEVDVVGEFA